MATSTDDLFILRRMSRDQVKEFTQDPSLSRRSSLQDRKETMTSCKLSDKLKAYKNLLGVSVSFALVFGSFQAILSLQSTVNSEGGLGLATSAVDYASVIIAAFIGPSLVELIGTKYALISGYILLFMQILLNYYASWYTLVPGALLNGIGQPPVWICIYAHVISIAIYYSSALNEAKGHAVTLFASVVTASVKLSQVPGGIATSLVLINVESNSTNSTGTCELEESSSLSSTDVIYYILISVYVLMDIIGIAFAVFLMDHLGTKRSFMSAKKMLKLYFGTLPFRVLKTMFNWKMLLMFPMIILNGIALGYTFGTFPKVLVADCIGVKWIGFTIACNGIAGCITAVTVGRSRHYIPQFILVYVSLLGLLGLSLFLILYDRQASFVMAFLYIIAWGIFEATFNTVSPGMLSVLFHGKKEKSALSLLQVGIAFGFTISFVTGIFLSYITQLWIIIGFILLTTITYSIVFFANATKERLAPCIYKEEMQENEEELIYGEYIIEYETSPFSYKRSAIQTSHSKSNGVELVSVNKETPI